MQVMSVIIIARRVCSETCADVFIISVRFTIKAPEIPRKDRDLPNVIISETKDMAITKHQVSGQTSGSKKLSGWIILVQDM